MSKDFSSIFQDVMNEICSHQPPSLSHLMAVLAVQRAAIKSVQTSIMDRLINMDHLAKAFEHPEKAFPPGMPQIGPEEFMAMTKRAALEARLRGELVEAAFYGASAFIADRGGNVPLTSAEAVKSFIEYVSDSGGCLAKFSAAAAEVAYIRHQKNLLAANNPNGSVFVDLAIVQAEGKVQKAVDALGKVDREEWYVPSLRAATHAINFDYPAPDLPRDIMQKLEFVLGGGAAAPSGVH